MIPESELNIIKNLSKRIVEAQSPIRILDCIKWDESIKRDFFQTHGKKLPKVDLEYYQNRALPFNPEDKIEEFCTILRDAKTA